MRSLVLVLMAIGCSKSSAPSAAPGSGSPPPQQASTCSDPAGCLAACESGTAAACFLLGSMYENGAGVASDADRAASFYKRACTGGYTAACDRKVATIAPAQAPPAPTATAAPSAAAASPAIAAGSGTPAGARPKAATTAASVPTHAGSGHDALEDQRLATLQAQQAAAKATEDLARQRQADEKAEADRQDAQREAAKRKADCEAEYKKCEATCEMKYRYDTNDCPGDQCGPTYHDGEVRLCVTDNCDDDHDRCKGD